MLENSASGIMVAHKKVNELKVAQYASFLNLNMQWDVLFQFAILKFSASDSYIKTEVYQHCVISFQM